MHNKILSNDTSVYEKSCALYLIYLFIDIKKEETKTSIITHKITRYTRNDLIKMTRDFS